MSSYTLGIIILILSSLILSYSVFSYTRWYKNGELANLSLGEKFQTVLIWTFWIMAFVGSIFLLQEKEMSVAILYLASYLALFVAFIQLIGSVVTLYKAKSGKAKASNGDLITFKAAQQSGFKNLIQFIIVSALATWFQDWLWALTF